MESSPQTPGSDQVRADLAAADLARERMATRLRLPRSHQPLLACAVAIQIGTGGVGIAEQTTGGLGLVLGGLGVFLVVAVGLLMRFRQLNGVRVDGLTSQVVLAQGTTASVAYLAAFAAASWAAFESQWWLVALAAVAGGVGYAVGNRQWWLAYRSDPATHAAGASPRLLAALAVACCVGFVVLVVVG